MISYLRANIALLKDFQKVKMSTKKNDFLKNGYSIISQGIPHNVIDRYTTLWKQHHTTENVQTQAKNILSINGWENSGSYIEYPEIRDILCHDTIFSFLAEINPLLCLHLCFSGWTSTQKDWHADVSKRGCIPDQDYVGAWVALEDINPLSGPFEIIPGSHLWDISIREEFDENKKSKLINNEIIKNGKKTFSFLGKKGDILIWSGNLIHRGSVPKDSSLLRKSLIGHYNMISDHVSIHGSGRYYSNRSGEINLYKPKGNTNDFR